MLHSAMEIIESTDGIGAKEVKTGKQVHKSEYLAMLEQREKKDRSAVCDQIQAAMGKIKSVILEDYETANQARQVHAEKLQALERKLEELPDELSKLDIEESRVQADIGAAIEGGKSLAKLTKDLTSIRAKKQEIEVMHEILENKIIPDTRRVLEEAEKGIFEMVSNAMHELLTVERADIDRAVSDLNKRLLGWAYAQEDVLGELGLMRAGADHLAIHIATRGSIPDLSMVTK